jgi:hypothetical protein
MLSYGQVGRHVRAEKRRKGEVMRNTANGTFKRCMYRVRQDTHLPIRTLQISWYLHVHLRQYAMPNAA